MVLSGSLHRKVRRSAAELKNEQLWGVESFIIPVQEVLRSLSSIVGIPGSDKNANFWSRKNITVGPFGWQQAPRHYCAPSQGEVVMSSVFGMVVFGFGRVYLVFGILRWCILLLIWCVWYLEFHPCYPHELMNPVFQLWPAVLPKRVHPLCGKPRLSRKSTPAQVLNL